jgi:hypothetical protein
MTLSAEYRRRRPLLASISSVSARSECNRTCTTHRLRACAPARRPFPWLGRDERPRDRLQSAPPRSRTDEPVPSAAIRVHHQTSGLVAVAPLATQSSHHPQVARSFQGPPLRSIRSFRLKRCVARHGPPVEIGSAWPMARTRRGRERQCAPLGFQHDNDPFNLKCWPLAWS